MAKLYKVEDIDGKGKGVISTMVIEKGKLVQEENPQIMVAAIETSYDPKLIDSKSIIDAFNNMTETNREKYSNLSNKYG